MDSSLFNLNGKSALITGAGSGLGARFAQALSAFGAAVICSDVDHAAAKAVAALINSTGGSARSIEADISSSMSLENMQREIHGEKIDVLVNNAGVVTSACRTHEIAESDWDRVMSINLKGAFLCSKLVLPLMLKHSHGSIINISSILGVRGFFPGFSAVAANYFAAKAGIIGLTRQMAVEYARDGIRTNTICPGFHEATALGQEWRALKTAEQLVKFNDAVLERTPLGRKGRPEELDGLIVYLASDASRYVTGQVFHHDGGWTAA
jgi:NAD(P)-dependent dehydrogenase (short-subunit alcohol dehydrogenase family)